MKINNINVEIAKQFIEVIQACDIMREVLLEKLKKSEKLIKGIQNLK